jgi:branched-chain amino acid transport system ATP-binding protein
MTLLTLEDVHAFYGDSYVLQGVNLTVGEQEIVGLLGRNGAGKTTTIHSIIGFTPPRRGRIVFDGEEITGKPPYHIARRGIGLVPQGRRIFPSLDVLENLTIGFDAAARQRWTLERIFELFPRLAERRRQPARTLSGGERSMLTIARALLTNPRLLLMDEPTEGLAPVVVEMVADAIRALRRERQSILLVEQDLVLALDLVDRLSIMNKGVIVFEGTPQELHGRQDLQARYLGV